MFKRFIRDRRGNFAVIAALSAVPVIGLSGLAIDYSRSLNAKAYMQDQGDAIALSIASRGPTYAGSNEMRENLKKLARDNAAFGDIQFEMYWLNANDFLVETRSRVPLTLSSVIPNTSDLEVVTRSTARFLGSRYIYKPPTVAQLAPEAHDYNRISAYCYSPANGRSQMTDIADNVNTKFNYTMPRCDIGEVLSYRLLNIESAKYTNTWRDKLRKNQSIRYYYTDTTIGERGEIYDLGGKNVLETVLCAREEQCKANNSASIIPSGKNRANTRQRANRPCYPGAFMYYGWEDRPPPGGDADYDDIRIVIECPMIEVDAYENVVLIR